MKKFLGYFFACALGATLAIGADRYWGGQLPFNQTQKAMTGLPVAPSRTAPSPARNLGELTDFREAAETILPSVVSIDVVGLREDFFGVRPSGDSGSGVILSAEGHVVTNAHVVEGAGQVQQISVHLADGRSFEAKLLGADSRSDLAVLKIEAPNLVPAAIGKSSDLRVGEWVLAVGNPFNQSNTVSAGIVGNIGRDLQVSQSGWLIDAIQTDASINPGNSGGALTNSRGELIGINTVILSPGRSGSIGLGYAISIDRARPVIDDLISIGRARYGELGIDVAPRQGLLKIQQAREQYKRETGFEPPQQGALIIQVKPGSPAASAKLEILDIIQRVNNQIVNSRDDFVRLTYGLRPGESVELTYWSKGKAATRKFVLSELTGL